MSRFVMAIDQGTTGSTVMVFDRRGRVRSRVYSEFTQHYPRPAWVEHDAEQIWKVTRGLLARACRKADIKPSSLAAIGITNQRETTVVWDRSTGEPIHRAIVWQDRRTASHCARLKAEGHEHFVRQRTGLVLDPYFSGTKATWILDNVPGARDIARNGDLAFGTIDSFLLWRLPGGRSHATAAPNASRTMLFDIFELQWDDDLLSAMDIPRQMLPEVKDSSGVFGETDRRSSSH